MTNEEMKKEKEELGISAAKLSELAGIPVGTLQKILSGETKSPRYETRVAIERALKQARGGSGKDTGVGVYSEALKKSHANAPGMLRETPVEYGSSLKNQGEYTLEDYYAWPEDQRIELIDGVVYDMASPTFIHQRFLLQFAIWVQNFIDKKKGDCIPMVAPVDVRLDCDNRTMVQPDALILCDKSKIRRWGIDGAPDFVLEVLSSSTRKKDLTLKMKKYINAGVKEYWILDPRDKRLYTYDFMDEGIPGVYPLRGEVGLALFGGELKIPLDELAAMFADIPQDEED